MEEPKSDIRFGHVLVYLWMVGIWPTMCMVGLFWAGTAMAFYTGNGFPILLAVFISLPSGVAIAIRGIDRFFKRYPQYQKDQTSQNR